MLAAANWGLLPGYTVIGITLGGIYALARSASSSSIASRGAGTSRRAQCRCSALHRLSDLHCHGVSGAGRPARRDRAGGAIGYVIERFTIRPWPAARR